MPIRYASGPSYPPPLPWLGIPSGTPASGLISASARPATGTDRRLSPTRTRAMPLTRTATRVGANVAPGNVTRACVSATPLRRAPRTAADRARVRYTGSGMWRGFGTPSASTGGSNSRG
ncbi:MAG TPA: hypothetical protein VEX39_07445 [Thermoleophilaceae bacterium]|nr:hypothetical protein [Thermoleophilaceae bacterium]